MFFKLISSLFSSIGSFVITSNPAPAILFCFNETIKSRFRDTFNYNNFSEGEKLRIDLSILFTWREIAKLKNSTNTNLLILDEIFDSSLDSSGTDEFMRILHTTMNKENVFVISHKGDTLLDKFPRVMKFEKYKNFTRMVE